MSKQIDGVWANEDGLEVVMERDKRSGAVRITIVAVTETGSRCTQAFATVADWRWTRLVAAMELPTTRPENMSLKAGNGDTSELTKLRAALAEYTEGDECEADGEVHGNCRYCNAMHLLSAVHLDGNCGHDTRPKDGQGDDK